MTKWMYTTFLNIVIPYSKLCKMRHYVSLDVIKWFRETPQIMEQIKIIDIFELVCDRYDSTEIMKYFYCERIVTILDGKNIVYNDVIKNMYRNSFNSSCKHNNIDADAWLRSVVNHAINTDDYLCCFINAYYYRSFNTIR
jgi:hypothetical protein